MKTSSKSAVYILVLFFSTMLFSQSSHNDDLISHGKALSKQAYLSYDKDSLLSARNIFQNIYTNDKSSLLPLYYLTLIDYKLLEMSLRGDEALFEKYYENALTNAEKLSNDNAFKADGKILLAGIYMMKIATSSMSAVTLSPKIHSLLDDAQKLNSNKPYSYVIRGMMKYNTPGIFGGSYEDALNNFNQAIKLFEKEDNSDPLTPEWGYVETLAWKGRALIELDNYEAAQFTFKKALNEEPDFSWVKNVLLPQLNETLSNK